MSNDLPLPREFFHPVLQVLVEAPLGLRRRDIYEPTADRVGLTAEQRALRLPNRAVLKYRHRIGWCINMLKNAGLVERSDAGAYSVTVSGRDFLGQHPSGLSRETQLELTHRAREGARAAKDHSEPVDFENGAEAEQTPEERAELAVREHHDDMAQELLGAIRSATPGFFEGLVLDVLHAMGYGTNRTDLQRVGAAGDGGIDGIISLDRLGLEKVYVQAKRYAEGNTVGRPAIQGFFGALAGRRAKKGVFITTSSFTADARAFTETVSDSIVLLDGRELALLMIEYGVGVASRRTLRLVEVDSDYFNEG